MGFLKKCNIVLLCFYLRSQLHWNIVLECEVLHSRYVKDNTTAQVVTSKIQQYREAFLLAIFQVCLPWRELPGSAAT